MLTDIKARIIKQEYPTEIKLKRRKIEKDKDLYELSIIDFCRLIDALSKGSILSYISYSIKNNNYVINEQQSLIKMMTYLLDRLSLKYLKQIFGEEFNVTSIEEFIYFISQCKWYTKNEVNYIIRKYIDNNFNLLNTTFIRKTNKRG